jgi:hypothetical protein
MNNGWRLVVLVVLVASSVVGTAEAQSRRPAPAPIIPGIAVTVDAFPEDRVAPTRAEYLRVLRIAATEWNDAEVKLDRRLVEFVVTETQPAARGRTRTRTWTCKHHDAARAARGEARAERLVAGNPYVEWLDLREYCWGDALRAVERGATMEASFGPKRAPNRRFWVARSPSLSVSVARVPFGAITTPFPRATSEADASVRVSMSPIDAATTPSSFSVTVSSGESHRVYLATDLFSFAVRGAVGKTACSIVRTQIVPLPDFFSRIAPRRSLSRRLDANAFCRDAFPVAGIYEVTPRLTLPYRASQTPGGENALTGEFVGEPAAVRIRRPGTPYVEQHLDDLPRAEVGS